MSGKARENLPARRMDPVYLQMRKVNIVYNPLEMIGEGEQDELAVEECRGAVEGRVVVWCFRIPRWNSSSGVVSQLRLKSKGSFFWVWW